MVQNSEYFSPLRNGSERNSENFLFRGTAGIPPEQTNCSVYSVFRRIIFLSEIANPILQRTRRSATYCCKFHYNLYFQKATAYFELRDVLKVFQITCHRVKRKNSPINIIYPLCFYLTAPCNCMGK